MDICGFILLALLHNAEGWLFRRSRPVPRRICHVSIGTCFEDAPPFDNVPGYLPSAPEDQQITIRLYTQGTPDMPESLDYQDDDSIIDSNFDADRPSKMIIHGFGEWGDKSWVREMRNAILDIDDVNLLIVDWKEGAMPPNYPQSVANTRVVGFVIAKLITRLNYLLGASFSSFHLIGHSLGAHVAGYAGRRIRDGMIGRITGLDPAGPNFEDAGPEVILDETDALFVDVIHTNAKPLSQFGYGIQRSVGHVDFYPNGGKEQPGCPSSLRGIMLFLNGNTAEAVTALACSHERGYVYFIASITGTTFLSYPCASKSAYDLGRCNTCGSGCVNMGYFANPNRQNGTYYLTTGQEWPSYPHDLSQGVLAAIN